MVEKSSEPKMLRMPMFIQRLSCLPVTTQRSEDHQQLATELEFPMYQIALFTVTFAHLHYNVFERG